MKNPHDKPSGTDRSDYYESGRHDGWNEGHAAGLAECALTHFKPDWEIGAQAIKDAADEAYHSRDEVVQLLIGRAQMAMEELCFGGDWDTAKRLLSEAITKARS